MSMNSGLDGEVVEQLAPVLTDRGYVSRQQMDEARQRAKWTDESLYDILLHEGIVSENILLEILSEFSGIPFRKLLYTEIDVESIRYVNAKVAVSYHVMPLGVKNEKLILASDRIFDSTTADQLRLVIGFPVEWVLCARNDLNQCIKYFYGVGIETFVQMNYEKADIQGASASEHETTQVTAFVQSIIEDAVGANATDIHFEPDASGLNLRYRIDGVLSRVTLPEGAQQCLKAVVSAIKVMAQLNIAEKRLPQDGRFSTTFDGESIDLRVSVLPSSHGEAVNLRILKREGTFLAFEQLGLLEKQRQALDKLIRNPHGVILFTGPTGSGKTTSLYATLASLNTDERKIITLEDPVEYDIRGIMQLQVNPAIGFTFGSGLRSTLRHDPDIVLIGEIRDYETAEIAVSSALTGHLVFSTLHTNDSASAVTRLSDIGVEPYLIASGLKGVVSQRLVRRICDSCKVPSDLDSSVTEKILASLPDANQNSRFYKGEGCPDCRFTGYRGRKAVFEILVVNDQIRKMVVQQASSSAIMEHAVSEGLQTLRNSCIACAADGVTTIEEVLRVT